MSIVRIIAARVEEDQREVFEHFVSARARAYEQQGGFERVELLEPTDGRSPWLLVLRFADEASFDAFIGGSAPYDDALAGRLSTHGVPDSFRAEIWSFNVAVDASA